MTHTKMPKDSLLLMEKKEADSFEEAYPIGNGHLGAMIYGGAHRDTLTLNHDELWSGYPRNHIYRGDKKASLDRAKHLMLEKKYADADAELKNHFSSYGGATYMPMGTLAIDYSHQTSSFRAYRRKLDLSRALASVEFLAGKAQHRRIAYISHPHALLVYRNECENGIFDAQISLQSQLYSKVYVSFENQFLL